MKSQSTDSPSCVTRRSVKSSAPKYSPRRPVPEAVLAERLRQRGRAGGEVSDGREELLAEHRARYESPEGEPNVIRLDTTGDADPENGLPDPE